MGVWGVGEDWQGQPSALTHPLPSPPPSREREQKPEILAFVVALAPCGRGALHRSGVRGQFSDAPAPPP